jgi:hypothetical protein
VKAARRVLRGPRDSNVPGLPDRGQVAGLLGTDYTRTQMTYDLRRLRLHGLIERIPHTNTYVTTPEGIRVAVFHTKALSPAARPPPRR